MAEHDRRVLPLTRTRDSRASGTRSAPSLTRTVRGHREVSRSHRAPTGSVQSPPHERQSLNKCVVQARVVCTCAWKCSQLPRLNAGIANIKKWRRFHSQDSFCLLTTGGLISARRAHWHRCPETSAFPVSLLVGLAPNAHQTAWYAGVPVCASCGLVEALLPQRLEALVNCQVLL